MFLRCPVFSPLPTHLGELVALAVRLVVTSLVEAEAAHSEDVTWPPSDPELHALNIIVDFREP